MQGTKTKAVLFGLCPFCARKTRYLLFCPSMCPEYELDECMEQMEEMREREMPASFREGAEPCVVAQPFSQPPEDKCFSPASHLI